jgi:hypothetical protein
MGTIIGAGVFVLSGYLLCRSIATFRRDWIAAEVLRAPAAARQTLQIPVAGELALFLEGPRFETWRQRCDYRCTEVSTAATVPVSLSFSGSGARSRRYSRVQHARLSIPQPGAYVLDMTGLRPPDAPGYAVVLMHPSAGRLLRFILTCVALGLLVVGSGVLALLAAVL